MAFAPCLIITALLTGVLFCSTTCSAQNAGSPSALVVSGSVQDALGRPISGAKVTLASPAGNPLANTATDERGVFWLKEANPGAYVMTVRSAGFLPASATVILPQRKAIPIKITLESRQVFATLKN